MTGLDRYKKREWFTITELVQAARCPRKWFYQSGCWLRSRDLKIAQEFGSAIHAGAIVGAVEGLGAGIAAFEKYWMATGLEGAVDGSGKEDKRTAAKGRAILANFVSSRTGPHRMFDFVAPPKTFDAEDHISPYELPFAIDIGLDVPLIGRADGMIRMRSTGQLWTYELKTTSEMGSRFLSAFEVNTQAMGYTVAARAMYELAGISEPIIGCLLDGVWVAKTGEQVQALPVFVPPHYEKMFLTWARTVGEMILECERRGEFVQYPSGCNQIAMFGLPGYNCEFLPLCKVPDWTTMEGLYQVSRHVPFKVKTEGTEARPQGTSPQSGLTIRF